MLSLMLISMVIEMCVCVCVCVCEREREGERERMRLYLSGWWGGRGVCLRLDRVGGGV